jgi:glycosyltransferase involved in cell wall biosynthesis
MKKLYFIGERTDCTGWGILTDYLSRYLEEFCEVVRLSFSDDFSSLDAPVFLPVSSNSLQSIRPIKCPRLIGYGFWEWPFEADAVRYASQYYWLFAGSQWCTNKLLQITPRASCLVQGIDFDRFTIQPYVRKLGFHVFSGGKFEFRKGQDLVIAVMREFMSKHDDVSLVTAWHNPWPESKKSMDVSLLINNDNPLEGLPEDRVLQKPLMPNSQTPEIYGQTDIGLFLNRGEGGTNLVMMEYMASGRPVIASFATGQTDVLRGDGPIKITKGLYNSFGWFQADLLEVYRQLELAYNNSQELPNKGLECRKLVEPFTWRKMAQEVARVAFQS